MRTFYPNKIHCNYYFAFQDDDLEGDFDPDQYDRKMGEIFNQDYYHVDNENQKPEFPYDPEIDDGITTIELNNNQHDFIISF